MFANLYRRFFNYVANKKRKLDDYFDKKSKRYFLLKRMKVYEDKLQHKSRWTFRKLVEYERKWRRLVKKYNKVSIYGIQFVSIGETVPRYFMYLRNHKKRDKNTYYIILPTFFPNYTGGIFNKAVFRLFSPYMHFITKDNFDFWWYVIIIHSRHINIEDFDLYRSREARRFNVTLGQALLPFSSEVESYAKEKMTQMGVHGKYICLYARETATKAINFQDYPDTAASASDINTYGQAYEYMKNLGYQGVRMGKYESKRCTIEGVIDYSNYFYDELMDFYLIANCKFMIGAAGGVAVIVPFWGRPLLLTNAVEFCYGCEALPKTEYDLYIPKKFYSKKEKRLLNLYEIFIVTNKCGRHTVNYEKEGIEVIDNTADEILKATIEMNEKLDHTWIRTEEEERCMEKYWSIMNLWKRRHKTAIWQEIGGHEGYEMIFMPIAYSFLKEHMYLLDIGEIGE